LFSAQMIIVLKIIAEFYKFMLARKNVYLLADLNLGCLHSVVCVRSGDGGGGSIPSMQRYYRRLILLLILLHVSVIRPSSGRYIYIYIINWDYSTDNGSVVFRI
jgi:hypothetical protein